MGVATHRLCALVLTFTIAAPAMGVEAQGPDPGAGADREVAQAPAASQPAPKDPSGRSWAARHPVVLGTLIGAAGVAVAGAAGRGNRNPGIMGLWVLAGAGGGALAGSIASGVQKSRLKYDPSSSQPDALAVKRIVTRLGVGERVIVTTVHAQQIKGRIQSIGQDELGVVPDGQVAPMPIAYATIRRVRATPMSTGKKIGIASGIIGGIAASWLVCFGAGGCGGVS